MNDQPMSPNSWLDILFEGRNKEYGAYPLRKQYGRRLTQALLITLGAAGVMALIALIPGSRQLESISYIIAEDPTLGKIKEELKPKTEIKKLAVKPEQLVSATRKFISNIRLVDNRDSSEKIETLDGASIGSKNLLLPGTYQGVYFPEDDSVNTGSPQTVEKKFTDRSKPVANPDVYPSFPGGAAALRRFMERNLSNPRDLEEGEVVAVKVAFVVGFDGKLKSFEILEDGGEAFNNEVLRVMKKMPDWIPGKANGENVTVSYAIPVKFIAGN